MIRDTLPSPIRWWLPLALVMAWAGAARAQLPADAARELLTANGQWALAETAAVQLKLSVPDLLSSPGQPPSDDARQTILARAEARITASAIRERLLRELAPRVAPADLPLLLAGWRSPAAQAVVAATVKAQSGAHLPGADPEAPGRAWHNAGVARQNLVDEVTAASGETDLAVAMYLRVSPAMRRTVNRLDPSPFRPSDTELAHSLAHNPYFTPAEFKRQLHFTLPNENALRLQAIDDATLQRWLDFLRSPAQQRLKPALLDTLVAVNVGLVESLAEP